MKAPRHRLANRGELIEGVTPPVTLANSMLEATLQDIAASQQGPLVAVAKVRPANVPSRALLRRHGFRPLDSQPNQPELRLLALRVR